MRRILPACVLIWGMLGTANAQSERQDRVFDELAGQVGPVSAIEPNQIVSSAATAAVPNRHGAIENTTLRTTSAAPADLVKAITPDASGGTLPSRTGEARTWRIFRLEWTGADEKGFEDFVRTIGESNCKTMHECLTSPVSNPRFHATNPPDMRFFAD